MQSTHRFSTIHADEKLWERYGIIASHALWRQVFLDIIEGRTLLLARMVDDGGKERHLVRIEGEPVFLLYSPLGATVVTVLPQNCKVFPLGNPLNFYKRNPLRAHPR